MNMKYFTLIFALALIIRIWFNWFDPHINTAFSCDAAEYLRDAQNLALCGQKLFCDNNQSSFACLKVLNGQASLSDTNAIKSLLAPLKEMSISGPVFPLFLLGCYKIWGQNPSMDSWIAP